MKRSARPLSHLFGFAVLLAGLITVFVAVLERRFSTGDFYPHYSTERSDPLGASALRQSLAALPGYEVTVNRQSLMALRGLDADSALWLCGVSRRTFSSLRGPEDSPILKAVRDDGARLILTINPEAVPEKYDLKEQTAAEDWWDRREAARKAREEEPTNKEKADDGKDRDSDEETDEEAAESDAPSLSELFEVKLTTPDRFERPKSGWELARGESLAASRPVPETLPEWRSQYRFTDLGPDWKVVASVDGQAVVVERPYGSGTVVLASDSYFASNEALWQGAEADFLLWLTGGKQRVVFDETVHGSVESGGAMKMIRRYRFHGFLIGCLGFIALLAWRSASPLAPGSEAVERGLLSDSGDAVAGENAASGFIRLLQRSVPGRQLLRTCLETWRETAAQRLRGESGGQREAIDRLIAAHEADPKQIGALETYQRIADVLAQPDAYREPAQTPAPAEKPA